MRALHDVPRRHATHVGDLPTHRQGRGARERLRQDDDEDLFSFEQTGIDSDGRVVGEFRPTGIRPSFSTKFEIAGVHLPTDLFSKAEEV